MELKEMSVRSTIETEFARIATEQNRTLAPLSDDVKLVDSGLDSLSFAMVVMSLEETFGFDPFNAEDVKYPVTFSDFVRLYENHLR
jgi:acyl carrier protein